ncbi:MAG: hypothetical protein EPN25_03175 [Nitrospirae bacterium]|nr:MAG: hypothetical protein EPN25_03175 [Nitrospirota bacterium]
MGIRFRFELNAGRRRFVLFGAGGLLALLAFLSLPSLLAQSLDAGRAKQEVRQYLKRQLGDKQLAELRAAGLVVPDHAMASRWAEQHKRIDNLAFASLKVGRLPYLPFSSGRVFMVKAVLRDVDNTEQTHFFSLSSRHRLYDFFWVTEQSRLLWLLAF